MKKTKRILLGTAMALTVMVSTVLPASAANGKATERLGLKEFITRSLACLKGETSNCTEIFAFLKDWCFTPEAKPEVPETKPEVPETNPEVPETNPEEKPDVPETTPEVKPEVPEVKPEVPEVEPEVPEVEPEQKPETEVPSSVHSYEAKVVELVNAERAKNGLSPLTLDAELCQKARVKSQDMAENNYFSHTSPTYGSPFDMMKKLGITYRSAGENIAMGYATPEAVVRAWMNSEGHRANILSEKYTRLGVGYVANGNYWTQWFVG